MVLKSVMMMLGLVAGNLAMSQASSESGWLASFNMVKLNSKLSLHADMQFRSTDGLGRWQTILLRPGLNYHAGQRSIASAGYAFISNRASVAGRYGLLTEHRLWQQFIYNQPIIRRVALQHRFRFEERWIPQAGINNGMVEKSGDFFATRFRYFFRTVIPWQRGKTAFSKGMFSGIQNEVFLHTSNREKLNGKTFDQNRLYLSAGYRVSKQFDLEAGYLWQYTDRRSPVANNNNHIAQLAVYTRL